MSEDFYLQNYDNFKKIAELVSDTLPYKHQITRSEPSFESKKMFNYFKNSEIIHKKLDIGYFNKRIIGDFFDLDIMSPYNYLNLSGPRQLIEQFESSKLKTIIINSVRSINVGESKKLYDPNILDFDKYKKQEQPITQQYCNWYEYFESDNYKWNDINIVIMTREDLYEGYRELYPHFLICTHTSQNYTTVGLTRHSCLMLSHLYNYKKILMVDDNLIDIVDNVLENVDTKKFVEFLFTTKIFDNTIGYASLSKCKLFEYIENMYTKYRTFSTYDKVRYVEINKHKTVYQQYPLINPHRQKFFLLNSEKLLEKKITFRIDIPIAEDINFTKDIYMANMSVIVIDYQFIEPFTNRRPMVCLSNYTFEPNKLYRCLSKKQKEYFLESGIINAFSDIFIWKGRIIYFDEIDIYAGSSVYGPYRLLSKSDYKSLVEKYPTDYKNFITTFKVKGCSVYCKKPNPNNIELINNEINNRLINSNNYVANCNITMETRNELDKVFRSLDMTEIKDNSLNIGIGMNKYALHFEFMDDTNHFIFNKMLEENIVPGLSKENNYLSSYFDNYENNHRYYHKILTIYSIYSKYLYLEKVIDHSAPNSLIKGLLIFGNKYNIQYSIYGLSLVGIRNAFLEKDKLKLKLEFDLIISKIINL